MAKEQQFYIKEFYTAKQLAEELGISVQTIKVYTDKGGLKCYRKGKKSYFLREDILNWIKAEDKETGL